MEEKRQRVFSYKIEGRAWVLNSILKTIDNFLKDVVTDEMLEEFKKIDPEAANVLINRRLINRRNNRQ